MSVDQAVGAPTTGVLIHDVYLVEGVGAFFYDDLAAIQAGAAKDGDRYLGAPATPGFRDVRQPAAVLRIGLRLSDGACVWGDAMSVQYAGAARRDPLFQPQAVIGALHPALRDALVGAAAEDVVGNLRRARHACAEPDLAHAAIAYGLSQALLCAGAAARRRTMAGALSVAFALPLVDRPVPIYAQSGEERYRSVDRMIAKRVDVLPHGLINSLEVFGDDGERFLDYVQWVRDRVIGYGDEAYRPELHLDVYGLAGRVFPAVDDLLAFMGHVEAAAHPFAVRIESPIIARSTADQIERMAELRAGLAKSGISVGIVADEWCNTIDDVRSFVRHAACDMIQIKMPDVGWLDDTIETVAICKAGNVGAFLGGSCTETDTSARYSVHLAIATQADQLLAKPGMGVDEGIMIVRNEQSSALAQLRAPGPTGLL